MKIREIFKKIQDKLNTYYFNADIKRKIYLLVIVFWISLTAFVVYDLYRMKKIMKDLNIDTSNIGQADNKPAQTPKPVVKEKICSYQYVMNEVVSDIDKKDKIQKNIGYQNNKVGLYIYAEVKEFTEIAETIVNSNGGEWGYVLIPYNVKDYNSERWGELFLRLKEKKLIPIVQLHDIETKDSNKINDQISKAAEFLNALEWPIRYRYISAFNEMNDKNFWKGEIDPEGYAKILSLTIDKFKEKNKNFFMLNGAFNISARNNHSYMDAKDYMILMDKAVPNIFTRLDGWASHPYPQPNFTGSPKATGRDSIRGYEWELEILHDTFKVDTSKLPVFITETGWPHKEGEDEEPMYLDKYKVSDNIRYAFEKVWMPDNRIVAITPFTIKYNPPHDHFSWVNKDNAPYPQTLAIKDIKKVKGKPPVVDYIKSKVLECTYE